MHEIECHLLVYHKEHSNQLDTYTVEVFKLGQRVHQNTIRPLEFTLALQIRATLP